MISSKVKKLGIIALLFAVLSVCVVYAVGNVNKKEYVSADTEIELKIESYNASYSESVYLLYAVSNKGFDRTVYPIKMLFFDTIQEEYTVDNASMVAESKGTVNVRGKKCVVFYSKGLAAKEMTEDIYSRAYVDINGKIYYSDVIKFSVLEYVYAKREAGSMSGNLQSLFNSLLNYGASAQREFDYKTNRLANETYYGMTVEGGKFPDGFSHARYKKGDKVKITALPPEEGMRFAFWKDENGIILSYDEEMEVTIEKGKTYTAYYKDISNVSAQLSLDVEIPYDGKVKDIDLPTAVSFEYEGATVVLDVTFDTSSFVENKIGTQTFYGTLTDNSAYATYGIQAGDIKVNVKTLPFTFEIDTNTGYYHLTGYYGSDAEVTVPTSYKNTFVTTIDSRAFNQVSSITNLTVPLSVTEIEKGAIFGCENIQSITLPFIGKSNDDYYNMVESCLGYIFGASSSDIHYASLPIALTEVNLIEGATKIGYCAFKNCSGITSFGIPSTVTSIRDQAFSGCTGLTEFTISDDFYWFGGDVFSSCTNLKRINVNNVDKLWEIDSGNGGTWVSPFSNGADLYCKGQKITEIVIPNGVTKIASVNIQGCTSVEKITVPSSVTELGLYPFWNMINLKEVVFEDASKITTFGPGTFDGCESLESFDLSIFTNLNTIDSMFYKCKSLKTVVIPEWIINMEYGAFSYCESLQEVTIPEGVEGIGQSAFAYCSALKEVSLPNSLLVIGDYAFSDCRKLTQITIPQKVYDIGSGAFQNCYGLSQIKILSTRLTSIGNTAFYDCHNLVEIYNLSNLTFEMGQDTYGGIAKYAQVIHFSLEENSLVSVDANGFVIYSDGVDNRLLAYVGDSLTVVIPESVNMISCKIFTENHTVTFEDEEGWYAIGGYDNFISKTNGWELTVQNYSNYLIYYLYKINVD